MIILEEWISIMEGLFKGIGKGQSHDDLHRQILDTLHEIDLNELEEYDGAKEKLSLFANHYKGFNRLDKSRQKKRIENAFVMLDKLKREYLYPKSLKTPGNCSELKKSVDQIRGVGPKRGKLFNSLDIYTLEDLLFHFPRVYDDRRKIIPLGKVIPGDRITVIGTVHSIKASRTNRGMNILQVQLTDDTGVLTLKWFNQPYLNKIFKEGQRITATGKVKSTGLVTREMNVAEFEVVNQDSMARKIYPIYPLTSGLYNSQLRKIIDSNMAFTACLSDQMPETIKEAKELPDLKDAVYGDHSPKSQLHLNDSIRRLKFDDFFYFELATYVAKRRKEAKMKKKPKKTNGKLAEQLMKKLPFKLTDAQLNVLDSLRSGLRKDSLMNLLVQGDVG